MPLARGFAAFPELLETARCRCCAVQQAAGGEAIPAAERAEWREKAREGARMARR